MVKSYARAPQMVTCEYCGTPIKLNSQFTYQKVSGFVKRRSGGGANAIVLKKPMEVFACEMCITKLKVGARVDQLTIDGDDQLRLA